MTGSGRGWVRSLAFAAVCGFATAPAWAGAPLWEATLPAPAKWHRLTGIGTLLVGTDKSLLSLDPDSGKLLWRRDDIAGVVPYNVREIDGLPIVVVSNSMGGTKAKTSLTAINFVTGETAWQTEPASGGSLGIYPVPDRNLVVLFETAGQGSPEGIGVYLRGIQASDGRVLWRTRFRDGANPLTLHVADDSGSFSPKRDLSGHQEPVFADGVMYVPFDGLAAFDLTDGHALWDVKFDTADRNYKRAYPFPVVDGDLVFAGARNGVVYAIERATGKVRWQSQKVRSGLVSQLLVTSDTVFARLGGNFYSQQDSQYKLDTPVGVIAIDRASGARRWEYLSARDGITNLVYLTDRRLVTFADGQDIIGIDSAASGRAVESFKVPIEFKRRISGVEVAAKGLKAASGFLTGGIAGALQGGLMGSDGKARLDVPVAIQSWADGRLLVRGQQHLLMFDPAAPAIRWSTYYPAPGVSGFAVAAMAALTVVSTAASVNTQMQGYGTAVGQGVQGTWGSLDALASRRYSASADAGRYTYVLTDVEDGGRRGVGIMAVDMSTGEPATQILLDDREPDYRVDDVMGRLYYLRDHRKVSAFALR